MDRVSILAKLIEVCNEIFDENEKEITENTSLNEDLGCDSLKKLIFINELESKFNISFMLEDSMKMNTISDVCDIIEKYL